MESFWALGHSESSNLTMNWVFSQILYRENYEKINLNLTLRFKLCLATG